MSVNPGCWSPRLHLQEYPRILLGYRDPLQLRVQLQVRDCHIVRLLFAWNGNHPRDLESRVDDTLRGDLNGTVLHRRRSGSDHQSPSSRCGWRHGREGAAAAE